jgi:hypothetical protein
MSKFHFELSTGNLYTDQGRMDAVEAGKGAPNLIQLLAAGKLFVANAAILEQPPEDSGVVPLRTILNVNQYGAVESDAYEHIDVDAWGRDDYISYGRWLHNATRLPRQPKGMSQLTQVVLRQAYYLGIGAPDARIGRKNRFGNLANFREAVGVIPAHKRNLFDSWDDQKLADHTETVFLELLEESGGTTGYVDLNAEIDRRAKKGPWPSTEVFRRDGGWPMKYMALNGYADVLSMGSKEYVDWGVNFRLANDGKLPTQEAIEFLSKTRRAPSWSKFLDMFRWADYLAEVDVAYDERKQQNGEQGMEVVRQELESGELPDYLVQGVPPEEAIVRRAKWRVVNELFPQLPVAHKRVIAEHVAPSELEKVLLYTGKPCMEGEDVQFAAAHVGVAEDLWPSEENKPFPYLKVPEKLLK